MTSTSWYWNNSSDQDIYVHVFDQNGFKNGNSTPYRYPAAKASPDDISWLNSLPSNAICTTDSSTTSGNTLYSGTRITSQKSCKPNTLNAGNWYNFPAATAGSNNASTSTAKDMPNSICPKGWQLPTNSGNKSYNNLIRTAYSISSTTSDSNLIKNTAMSFVRLGHYFADYGTLNLRGSASYYGSSTTYNQLNNYTLAFDESRINPHLSGTRNSGISIRCVSH